MTASVLPRSAAQVPVARLATGRRGRRAAAFEHQGEVVLGLGVALLGGAPIPAEGRGIVARDALAVVVEQAERELCARVTGLGQRREPVQGLAEAALLVGRDAGGEIRLRGQGEQDQAEHGEQAEAGIHVRA